MNMENKFDLAIYNRFKNGDTIVAELKAISEERRRWIAIYKPNNKPIDENEDLHALALVT